MIAFEHTILNNSISTNINNPRFRADLLYSYFVNFEIDENIKKEFVSSQAFF